MKYEFKKGDRVRRINNSLSWISSGDTAIVTEDLLTDSYDKSLYVRTEKDGVNNCGNVENFEKIEDTKPKVLVKPTHIVVWEEDRDPAKFFTSEKDATDFIKQLTEKSSVKQDSIVLVEIKSCKKIKIQKNLKKSDYKI